jgi:hypothetical protein
MKKKIIIICLILFAFTLPSCGSGNSTLSEEDYRALAVEFINEIETLYQLKQKEFTSLDPIITLSENLCGIQAPKKYKSVHDKLLSIATPYTDADFSEALYHYLSAPQKLNTSDHETLKVYKEQYPNAFNPTNVLEEAKTLLAFGD